MKSAELVHYMLALKLSQSELARLLPLAVTTVNRMCRGVTPVNPVVARLIRLWVSDPTAYHLQCRYVKMHKDLSG